MFIIVHILRNRKHYCANGNLVHSKTTNNGELKVYKRNGGTPNTIKKCQKSLQVLLPKRKVDMSLVSESEMHSGFHCSNVEDDADLIGTECDCIRNSPDVQANREF